jgi:hypothetical protein
MRVMVMSSQFFISRFPGESPRSARPLFAAVPLWFARKASEQVVPFLNRVLDEWTPAFAGEANKTEQLVRL